MIDAESEVREALAEKADEERRRLTSLPADLRRRVRVRLALNVGGVLLAVAGIALAITLPLRTISGGTPTRPVPANQPTEADPPDEGAGRFVGSGGETFAEATERAVIAEGQYDGQPWRVVLFGGRHEGHSNWCVDVEVTRSTSATCDVFDPSEPLNVWVESLRDMPAFLIGQVRTDVVDLSASLDDGRLLEADLVVAPERLDAGFNVAVLPISRIGPGWITARDSSGAVVLRDRLESDGFSFGAEEGAWVKAADDNSNYIGFYISHGAQEGCRPASLPPSDPDVEYIRRFACTEFRDVAPYLAEWWSARPTPGADDQAYLDWWASYPIGETLPVYE